MQPAQLSARALGRRALLCAVASSAAVLLALAVPSAAPACTTGGAGCNPGSGYTQDIGPWNCGAIARGTPCAYGGAPNSYGWGSARYEGAGDVSLCMFGGTVFYACGTNFAQGCYLTTCNDQSGDDIGIRVENFSASAHTIIGRAKA